jgi:hypothetical protein
MITIMIMHFALASRFGFIMMMGALLAELSVKLQKTCMLHSLPGVPKV